ncbi:MAG: sigma-E processing peptidase SpoIIGA [Bacillota bacterium]
MVVYADVLFINNTLMTLAIVWSVSKILDYQTKWWRLLGAALVGTVYTFIIIIVQKKTTFSSINILFYIMANLIAVYLMAKISFGRISYKKIIQVFFWIYFVTFLVIGFLLAVINILGPNSRIFTGKYIYGLITGLFLLLMIGKIGWRFFQKKYTGGQLFIPLKIIIKDREIELTGYLDTGNQLRDPLSGKPVIIVNVDSLETLFCKSVTKKIKQRKIYREVEEIIDIFDNSEYKERIRVLPFSDLGQEHGILPGIIPDKVILHYDGQPLVTSRAVLGLTKKKFSSQKRFQALIPPAFIRG